MNYPRMKYFFLPALLAIVSLAMPWAASSQEYCAQQAYPGNTSYVCFKTLSEAEEHLRKESTPVAGFRFLERTSVYPLAEDGRFIAYYNVPMMEPEYFDDDYYTGFLTDAPRPISSCLNNRLPYYGTANYACNSEQEQQAYMLADYPNLNQFPGYMTGNYTPTPTSVSGTQIDPVSNRAYVWAVYDSSTLKPNRGLVLQRSFGEVFNPVIRWDFHACPEGLGAFSENSIPKAYWPKNCFRPLSSTISFRPKSYSSCEVSEGPNPCNAATGAKEYHEDDFSFAGITFSRSYNSLDEISSSPLSPGGGWAHTFSSRLMRSSISQSVIFGIGNSGGVHGFRSIAGNKFVSLEKNSDVLAVHPEGGWTLQTSNGVDRYDSGGKFVSRQAASPEQSFELKYCTSASALSGECLKDGLLREVVWQSGRMLHFNYESIKYVDKANRANSSVVLRSIHDDSGAVLVEYRHDNYGRLISAKSGASSAASNYHYGRSESVCLPGSRPASTCREQDSRYLLTGVTGVPGNRNYLYNTDGKVISSSVGLPGNTATLAYASNSETHVIRPSGASVVYTFQAQAPFRPLTQTISDQQSGKKQLRRWEYDNSGRLLRRYHPDGSSARYLYDSETTTRIQEVDAQNAVRRITKEERDPTTNRPVRRQIMRPDSTVEKVDTWTYNARGQALTHAQSDPGTESTRQTTNTYCEQPDVDAGTCPRVGLLISTDGPRTEVADTAHYLYYPADAAGCAASPATCAYRKGDLWKTTNALGQTTETLRYDGAGRVLSIKDANGVVTDMTYHPRGWLTSQTVRGASSADDRTTWIEYAPTGLVSKTIQPDGSFVAFTYDPAHRLTGIADSAGHRIQYTLDNAGNRIKEDTQDAQGALVRTLSRVYNQLGQLTAQADAQANPTDFGYDANGNTQVVTDALGRTTRNDYDPLNRLTRTLQDVNGLQVETAFQYDALDNLVQVTDPKGLHTRYSYNALGDLLKLDSPDAGVTTYSHDEGGNRIGQTDARGVSASYRYDALNRLVQVGYGGAAADIHYHYDQPSPACAAEETFGKGRLTGMSDGSGETAYCYDRFGQLTRKVQMAAGRSHALRYAYTKGGQFSHLIYPDGSVIDYTRNGQGQVTEVGVTQAGQARQVLLNQARYHAFGPTAGWTYGNGRRLERSLDQDYQPSVIEDANAGGLSLGFGFDEAGQLVKLRTAANVDPPVAKFDYDGLGRLTAFRDGNTAVAIESYGYDKTGNRTQTTNAAGTTAYAYSAGSHRLEQVGNETRHYDAMGNTVDIGGTRSFDYDASGRMIRVKRNNAVAMNYAYNGRGEQVRRHHDQTDTTFVYDEAGRLLGEYASNGQPVQQYLWMDDLPVGLLAAGKLHYVQPDHLGTPRVVIDPVRDVAVWKWDLRGEAFGNSVPNEDPDGDGQMFTLDLRFPGQRHDAISGLSQNGFRDGYDPTSGRYTQPDPIGHQGGINTYAYVDSNPLIFTDSLGLAKDQACVAALTATGAVCGGVAGYYGGGALGGIGGAAVCSPTGPVAAACVVGGAAGGSAAGGAAGSVIGGILGNLAGQAVCPDDKEQREKRCNENLRRDLATCEVLGNRFGKKYFAVCQEQAMLRYGNCLSGRDEGIDAPLPPWGKI